MLAFAEEHKQAGWEACVAKPGLISSPTTPMKNIFVTAASWTGTPAIRVEECVAAMIYQVLNGFEKEPLNNVDLVRLEGMRWRRMRRRDSTAALVDVSESPRTEGLYKYRDHKSLSFEAIETGYVCRKRSASLKRVNRLV